MHERTKGYRVSESQKPKKKKKKNGEGSEGSRERECCRCERGRISECEKGISEVENGKVRRRRSASRCDARETRQTDNLRTRREEEERDVVDSYKTTSIVV